MGKHIGLWQLQRVARNPIGRWTALHGTACSYPAGAGVLHALCREHGNMARSSVETGTSLV